MRNTGGLYGRLAPGVPRRVAGALARYRIMAFVVGAMLLFLCAVAIPLQYAAGEPTVANVGFTVHGVIYIVYLLSVADLARRTRLRLLELVGLVCAGFLPGLAFYVEHRMSRRLLAAAGAEPDDATGVSSRASAASRRAAQPGSSPRR